VCEALALGLRFLRKGEHVFNRRAVFALEILEEVEPLFHRIQPLGVELDAVAVIAQVARQLAELLAERLRQVTVFADRGVNLGEAGERARGLPELVGGAGGLVRAIRERVEGVVGERGQFFRVGQADALVEQRLVLARLEPGGGDLVDLEVEHVQPPFHLALAQPQLVQFLPHAVKLARHPRQRLALVVEVREAVEQEEVLARAQEREVLALAVHVHEQLPDLFEDGEADDAPVDAADVAALAPHLAGERDLRRGVVQQRLADEDFFHRRAQLLP